MEPTTTATIILASIALIGATLANLRVRSRCHTENLDISIQKQFNKDLDNVLKERIENLISTSDSETEI